MGWALGSSNQRTQELSVVRHKYQIVDWEICPSRCPDVMLYVGWTLDREQWSQHREFVEINIGRTLPQSATVDTELADTISQVSEKGE